MDSFLVVLDEAVEQIENVRLVELRWSHDSLSYQIFRLKKAYLSRMLVVRKRISFTLLWLKFAQNLFQKSML